MLKKIDLSRTDLNLLVLFEMVLRERHVGRAAAQLNLSASAVSHGLGRLRRLLNDPLFLKNPKGVVPTARAAQLAEPIADILTRARGVVASSQRFDPLKSKRRFIIGAPDAITAVTLPSLLRALARQAPGVDLSVRALMPQNALAALDAHDIDIAIAPLGDIPPRFAFSELYIEDFVIAMRAGHPLAKGLTLERYCAASHLVVSMSGDPYSPVDEQLKQHGLSRRLALSVPSFLFALSVVSETDLVAALPRMLVRKYASRFPATYAEPPAPLAPMLHSKIRAIVPKAALMDTGTAWLFDLLAKTRVRKTARR
jgi:DNA-binding transcriptional LysR family regulator